MTTYYRNCTTFYLILNLQFIYIWNYICIQIKVKGMYCLFSVS